MTRNEALGLANGIIEADTKAARIAASKAFMDFWESIPRCAERTPDYLSLLKSSYDGKGCDNDAAPICQHHLDARRSAQALERDRLTAELGRLSADLAELSEAHLAAEQARATAMHLSERARTRAETETDP